MFFLLGQLKRIEIHTKSLKKRNINLIKDKIFLSIFQMADVIKSDIEKIERALNIRVDDVEIQTALNAGKYIVSFSFIMSNCK